MGVIEKIENLRTFNISAKEFEDIEDSEFVDMEVVSKDKVKEILKEDGIDG